MVPACKLEFVKDSHENDEDLARYPHYDYFPETWELPSLHIFWDRTLDRNSVTWLGTYGIWEGNGDHIEIAAELELHLNVSGESIYALADGVVVYDQRKANAIDNINIGNIHEGLWIRYGHRFMLKYVHIDNPTVKEGDRVLKGQRLGSTSNINGSGFWEVSAQVLDNGRSYSDCLYSFYDLESKNLFDQLWSDSAIGRTEGASWCNGGRMDETAHNRPGIW